MVVPLLRSAAFTPLTFTAHYIQRVYLFVRDLFRRIAEWFRHIPSVLSTYMTFQSVEWFVPSPLKAAANTCITYVRDFFSKETELKATVAELEQTKQRLENRVKELLSSRSNLLGIGALDQEHQESLNAQNANLRKLLSAANSRVNSANQYAEGLHTVVASLRRQIKDLEIAVNVSRIYLPSDMNFTEEEQAVLEECGIYILGDLP